ncbi:MAG: YlxR family protein [Candidatus Izemoplasmatales bacterium]|jgi:hypothetical protein
MAKPKKIPLRKCVVTGERYPKKELLRVVKTPEGAVVYDPSGKANGRGAYLFKSLAVIEKAIKTNILARHLETEIPEGVYEDLLRVIRDEQK